ncbi:hypothetical protein [Porphyromonas loveana]|uniref:hypothetical protein n=2 Tax=Porphyromonas loveana TaxID=1884669 RepID=UPI00359F2BE1
MNKANYQNPEDSSGGTGRYPISIETLEFIQGQIFSLQEIVRALGTTYIISFPSGRVPGQIVIDGEILPLLNDIGVLSSGAYIVIKEEHQGAVIDGISYGRLRTIRYALRTTSPAASGKGVLNEADIPVLQQMTHVQQTNKIRLLRVNQISDLDKCTVPGIYEVESGLYQMNGRTYVDDYRLLVEEVIDNTVLHTSFPPIRVRQTIVVSNAIRLRRYMGAGAQWDLLPPESGAILGVLGFRFTGVTSWNWRGVSGVFKGASVGLPYHVGEGMLKVSNYMSLENVRYVISSGERENVRGYSVEEVNGTLVVRGSSLTISGTTERAFTILAIAV